jgi:hypothetical protein
MPPNSSSKAAPLGYKECPKCGQFKPNADFSPARGSKPTINCAVCRNVTKASNARRASRIATERSSPMAESLAMGAARNLPILAPRLAGMGNVPDLAHRGSSIPTGTPQIILGSSIPDTQVMPL